MVGQVLDDLFDSLRRLLFLLGLVDRFVKEFQELFQRRVVHPTDHRHFDDTEVKSRSSDSDGSVLFSLLVDFLSLDFGVCQFDGDILRLSLSEVQHIHEFSIIQKISFGLSQSFQKILFESLKIFLVEVDIGKEVVEGVFQ